jgi:hypothetical protein
VTQSPQVHKRLAGRRFATHTVWAVHTIVDVCRKALAEPTAAIVHERKSRVTLAARLAGKTAAETISVMLAEHAEPAAGAQAFVQWPLFGRRTFMPCGSSCMLSVTRRVQRALIVRLSFDDEVNAIAFIHPAIVRVAAFLQ